MSEFDWNDLKFFLELVRAGNPASAGRRLHADHTTVRRRSTALEDSLQARLFSSRGPNYELTPEGEQLLRYAEAIESLAIRAEDDIAKRDLALSGTVRIGAPDGFGALYLTPRLKALAKTYPDLRLQVVILPRVVNLSNREADIAISHSRPNQQRQIVRRLTNYRLRLYAAPDYLAAHPAIEKLEDLSQHQLVGYVRDLLSDAELDIGPSPDESAPYAYQSTNIIAQVEAAAAGLGLCLLPDFIASRDSRLTPVLADSFKVIRQFWLVIHPEMINLARVRAAIDFVVECVRQDGGLFHDEPEAQVGGDQSG